MIGTIVQFRGKTFKVIANGDVPGTFDLHPYPVRMAGDSWRNVPPSELLPQHFPKTDAVIGGR